MPPSELKPVLLEEREITHRNFSGRPGPYNQEGSRGFSVKLFPEEVGQMEADGWNVKFFKDEEGNFDREKPFLPVAVNYKFKPPRIVLVSFRGRTPLDEADVNILDWSDIIKVDLVINPSKYDVNGAQGIKAYLKSMFVTIEDDPLERKYAQLDDLSHESEG